MKELMPEDRMECDLKPSLQRQSNTREGGHSQPRNALNGDVDTVLPGALMESYIPAVSVNAFDLGKPLDIARMIAKNIQYIRVRQGRRELENDVRLIASLACVFIWFTGALRMASVVFG
jgi:hypothetical protein